MYNVILAQSAVPEGRLFALDRQTFFSTGMMLLNACILAVVLGLLLYKPVREYMQKRADRIAGQLGAAKDKMDEADCLLAEYEKKLGAIETERIEILENAQKAAAERGRQIIDEAKKEAALLKRRAQESIESERQRLSEETRLHIIEISALMAGKYVQQTIDGATQDRLFDETMAELEEATWLS